MQFPVETLAPHQLEGLQEALDEFEHAQRAQIHMACGSGKTRLGQAVASQVRAQRILVLVPSLSLLSQTLVSWQQMADIAPEELLCVCSDPAIAQDPDDDPDIVDDIPVQVTTTPCDIADFAAGRGFRKMIVYCTYHSVPTLVAGLPPGFVFDIGIFDEAHRTTGPSNGQFAMALRDHKTMAISRRLFLTATPRHLPDADAGLGIAYSMDDEAVYGRTVYSLSLSEAIERGIITDYKILITVIDDGETKEIDQEIWSAIGDVDHHTALQALELLVSMQGVGARKAFTFHSRISRSYEFSSVLKTFAQAQHLPVQAWHVDGSMGTATRNERLTEFAAAGQAVVSCARCLSEGVDTPAVDMVAFMDPRESPIDIVQALGRTLRNYPGKKYGYVLLPLRMHLKPGESVEQAIESSPMSHIWRLLSALADQDATIMDELKGARRQLGRGDGGGSSYSGRALFGKIEFRGVDTAIVGLSRYIRHHVVERLTSNWEVAYGALERYKAEHGHCNVPRAYRASTHVHLGSWCSLQRRLARSGKLQPSRRSDLEALGFDFEPIKSAWEKAYSALKEYKSTYGHPNAPYGYVTPTGFALASWCSDQRKAFVSGRLSADREQRLRNLGFAFRVIDETWNGNLELLRTFIKEQGHSEVPPGTPGAFGSDLGAWVNNQRTQRDDPERRALLEGAGLILDQTIHESWESAFSLLLKYREEYGSSSPKLSYVTPDGFRLGDWVSNQRQRKKAGLLELSRVTRLEKVGFVFDIEQAAFDQGMSALLKYLEVHRHCNVPREYVTDDGYKLGSWCSNMRTRLKKAGYEDQREALQAIGFVFSVPELRWNEMYDAAREYLSSTSSSSVPVKYISPAGLKVGAWISRQRTLNAAGKLAAENRERLMKVGLL